MHTTQINVCAQNSNRAGGAPANDVYCALPLGYDLFEVILLNRHPILNLFVCFYSFLRLVCLFS